MVYPYYNKYNTNSFEKVQYYINASTIEVGFKMGCSSYNMTTSGLSYVACLVHVHIHVHVHVGQCSMLYIYMYMYMYSCNYMYMYDVC